MIQLDVKNMQIELINGDWCVNGPNFKEWAEMIFGLKCRFLDLEKKVKNKKITESFKKKVTKCADFLDYFTGHLDSFANAENKDAVIKELNKLAKLSFQYEDNVAECEREVAKLADLTEEELFYRDMRSTEAIANQMGNDSIIGNVMAIQHECNTLTLSVQLGINMFERNMDKASRLTGDKLVKFNKLVRRVHELMDDWEAIDNEANELFDREKLESTVEEIFKEGGNHVVEKDGQQWLSEQHPTVVNIMLDKRILLKKKAAVLRMADKKLNEMLKILKVKI